MFASHPVYVIPIAGIGAGDETDTFQLVLIRSNNARQNPQQLDGAAADDRQIIYLLGGDGVLLGTGLRLNLVRRTSIDGNTLSCLSDLH